MAFGQVSALSDALEDYPGYFLKFYEQGTTTPLSMATDAAAGTLLAKAEISSGGTVPIGFIKTAGDAIFIPWVDGFYDAFLIPTAAEADANDLTNAIQIADDINADPASSTNFNANAADVTYSAGNNFTGGIDRTQEAKNSDQISVKDFGLVPDGTTDNAANWNALVSYVNSIGGASISIPQGSYFLGSGAGLAAPSDSVLYGSGIGATIFVTNSSAATQGIFNIDGVSNLTIRDMTLQSLRAGDTIAVDNTGIAGNACSDILFEDVEIKDFGYYGFDIRESSDVRANRCRMTNIGRAGFLGIGVLRTHVHNSFIKDISPGSGGIAPFINRFGITFSMDESTPGQRSQYCSAVNNHIENVDSWEAIDTHGGIDLHIEGNNIINCAIGMFIGSATSTANLPPERIKFIGNTLDNSANAISRAGVLLSATPDAGVTVGHDFVIANNIIKGYGTHDVTESQEGAIDVGFARDVSITGNSLDSNRYAHIRLKEDIIACVMNGNTFIRGVVVDGEMWVLNVQNGAEISGVFDNNTAYREGGTLNGIWMQSAPSNELVFGVKVGANNRFLDLTLDFEASAAGRMHSQSGIFITDTTNATISAAGAIQSDNNVTSVVNSGTGVYDFTLTKAYINANSMKGAVSASSTSARIATFVSTAGNTFTVRIFDAAGTLVDTAFTVKVNGKINQMP